MDHSEPDAPNLLSITHKFAVMSDSKVTCFTKILKKAALFFLCNSLFSVVVHLHWKFSPKVVCHYMVHGSWNQIALVFLYTRASEFVLKIKLCLPEQFKLDSTFIEHIFQTFSKAFLPHLATVLSSCSVCPSPWEHRPGLKGPGQG